MKIISENKVNKNDIKNLVYCSHSSLKFMLILLIITFSLFFIFCLIVNSIKHNIGYCVIGILWCAFVYLYLFFINPKVIYNSFIKKYTKNAAVKFEFNKKYFKITIKNDKGETEKRQNYIDIFKAYETNQCFFFYVKRNEAYIMKKSGITQGTAEEITEILYSEMGAKFIRKVKKIWQNLKWIIEKPICVHFLMT